jgi:hypothetical protein
MPHATLCSVSLLLLALLCFSNFGFSVLVANGTGTEKRTPVLAVTKEYQCLLAMVGSAVLKISCVLATAIKGGAVV